MGYQSMKQTTDHQCNLVHLIVLFGPHRIRDRFPFVFNHGKCKMFRLGSVNIITMLSTQSLNATLHLFCVLHASDIIIVIKLQLSVSFLGFSSWSYFVSLWVFFVSCLTATNCWLALDPYLMIADKNLSSSHLFAALIVVDCSIDRLTLNLWTCVRFLCYLAWLGCWFVNFCVGC